ncbi:MAG: response regulator [Desulfobacteraceae bacterium]|nr:response regulator [Desulfobacteraceae bacterium]
MNHQRILKNKRILLVDDESDILETLEELLYCCKTDLASTFESAVICLKNNTYDVAILDIMGVRGHALLKITHKLDIPAIMLTAHALTPDNLKLSIEQGADAYVPKDKLLNISLFIADVLTAKEQGKKTHVTWFSLLKPVFDKLFGEGWRKQNQDFWDEFDDKQMAARDDIQKF